ncbi:MAG: urea carboxylase-associated family protein [Euryarchaeota archaeon]|nr:urea carboxylase-associated family protein [Euryarchaeota archaeon]
MHHRIPKQSGVSFTIDRGATFSVATPEGRQVADLVAFVRDSPTERFSQSYTRDLNGKIRITTDDLLYTTAGEPILAITDDDCGVHDILFGPCTGWMLTDRPYDGGVQNEPGGCRENLSLALAAAGVSEPVPDTLNVFQKSTITEQTYFNVRESPAEPGDTITFEAKQGAIVAVAACSAKGVASGSDLGPIDLTVPDETTIHERSVLDERAD